MLADSRRERFPYFYLGLRGGVLNHFCIGKSRNPETRMHSQDA